MHWHCESIELVILRAAWSGFPVVVCFLFDSSPTQLLFPDRSPSSCFVVLLAIIIIILWASRTAFYELSKTALSTRCIHKLVVVEVFGDQTNCYLAKGLYRLAARTCAASSN